MITMSDVTFSIGLIVLDNVLIDGSAVLSFGMCTNINGHNTVARSNYIDLVLVKCQRKVLSEPKFP